MSGLNLNQFWGGKYTLSRSLALSLSLTHFRSVPFSARYSRVYLVKCFASNEMICEKMLSEHRFDIDNLIKMLVAASMMLFRLNIDTMAFRKTNHFPSMPTITIDATTTTMRFKTPRNTMRIVSKRAGEEERKKDSYL